MSLGMIRTDGSVDRLVSQTRFVRINCADSLDRTNLGCYFTCLQVSIAMLLTLQVPFGAFEDKRPIPPLQDIEDGDYGSTLYSDPVPGAKQVVPQPYLNVWNDARNAKRVPAAIVRTLAEIFAHNGDCVAMLYTSSAAMHGNILRGVADMKMGSHNAVIATQRKYENAFEDGKKFRSIEILLGRNLDVHYKSFSPIYLTRPIPYNRWNTALVVQSLPADCTSDDVDKAIRSCWDQGVIPQLLANNIAPIESSALCLVISLQSRNSKDSEVATVVEQSIPTSSPSTSEGGRFPQTSNSGGLAVVEFDENLCSVVNAPALLRQQGCLIVNGCRCIMASYAYPINFNGDNSGNGYVKQVGTSLKKGFKTFMRNL
ncbi:hypothetical protein AGDE_00509 [Angomonas deanei]|uniref:Uncharacterized protein n=1 Tax=Angomonas deanei TaxID=59799 RepID=A0A7G2C8A1_9TRYP|nr:hypothetical protein AGDE_00509 [Angomonas deanei]CAD2215324.1 hypothetical protein, conserved [Angomonas deanei]|eukprot:EPY43412.1 hypothetical protein AGDE_00509 [Angomonas deanei]